MLHATKPYRYVAGLSGRYSSPNLFTCAVSDPRTIASSIAVSAFAVTVTFVLTGFGAVRASSVVEFHL